MITKILDIVIYDEMPSEYSPYLLPAFMTKTKSNVLPDRTQDDLVFTKGTYSIFGKFKDEEAFDKFYEWIMGQGNWIKLIGQRDVPEEKNLNQLDIDFIQESNLPSEKS